MPDTPAAPSPAPDAAPPRVGVTGDSPHEPAARPWELELFISGAVVFSLLQVPSAVDQMYDRLDSHLAGSARMAAFMVYYCLKLVLYTLTASFLVHLVGRAYWVGLIGLESVFPRGIRWDRTSYGPVMGEVYRERVSEVQRHIDGADRFCSVVFSFGFAVVLLLVFTIPVGALLAGVAFAASQLLFGGRFLGAILWILVAVLVLFPGVVWAIDRRWGEHLPPGSRRRRLLRALSLSVYYLQAVPIYGPTLMVLFTNVSKKKIYPAFYAVFVVLVAFFLLKDVLVRRGYLEVASYRFYPEVGGAWEVSPEYYENQRPAGEPFPHTPSIQSEVVREPYVRLFVPYSPRRLDGVMARDCPELRPLRDPGLRLERPGGEPVSDAAARAVLACWRRLQPVRLNGQPVEVDFRFHTHPRTGIRGFLGHLPVSGLPRGAHVLVVDQSPRADDDEKTAAGRRRNPHVIRFWI